MNPCLEDDIFTAGTSQEWVIIYSHHNLTVPFEASVFVFFFTILEFNLQVICKNIRPVSLSNE